MNNLNKDKELLAKRLKQLREEKNITKHQLGLKIGVHPQNIGKYERCETIPSALILKHMAAILGVTTDSLLNNNGLEQQVVDIKDRELLEKMKVVDQMNEENREFIKKTIDLVILQNTVKNLQAV